MKLVACNHGCKYYVGCLTGRKMPCPVLEEVRATIDEQEGTGKKDYKIIFEGVKHEAISY